MSREITIYEKVETYRKSTFDVPDNISNNEFISIYNSTNGSFELVDVEPSIKEVSSKIDEDSECYSWESIYNSPFVFIVDENNKEIWNDET